MVIHLPERPSFGRRFRPNRSARPSPPPHPPPLPTVTEADGSLVLRPAQNSISTTVNLDPGHYVGPSDGLAPSGISLPPKLPADPRDATVQPTIQQLDPDTTQPRPGPPNTGLEPVLPEQILFGRDMVQLLQELVDLREKDITRRVNLKNRVRDIEYQWQHAAKAQDSFIQACAKMMEVASSRADEANPERSLQEAWKQLQNLSGHVKAREMEIGPALNDLFQLENKLFLKEEKFYSKFSFFLTGAEVETPLGLTGDFAHLSEASSDASSASSVTIQSVAHKYYSRVGNMNLLRERIFNFDSEHRRQQIIRESQRKANIPVKPPDKIFFQKFLDQKEEMIRQYVDENDKMEKLMESCNQQGVEVQPHNLPPFLDHSLRIDRSVHNHSGPQVGADAYSKQPSHLQRTHSSQRLSRWLQEIMKVDCFEPVESLVIEDRPSPPGPDGIFLHARSVSWSSPKSGNFLRSNRFDTSHKQDKDQQKWDAEQADKFRGETPSRRHSLPSLPTFAVKLSLRDDDALELEHEGHFDPSCRSCVLDGHPNSDILTSPGFEDGTTGTRARNRS